MKFYTEEGNWDLVGNNTPVFFLGDPLKFPDLNHAVKRDPRTNLRSAGNNWDFRTSLPEASCRRRTRRRVLTIRSIKVWFHKDYPLIEAGVMELNRNPENYFAEVEQAAFNPPTSCPASAREPPLDPGQRCPLPVPQLPP